MSHGIIQIKQKNHDKSQRILYAYKLFLEVSLFCDPLLYSTFEGIFFQVARLLIRKVCESSVYQPNFNSKFRPEYDIRNGYSSILCVHSFQPEFSQ